MNSDFTGMLNTLTLDCLLFKHPLIRRIEGPRKCLAVVFSYFVEVLSLSNLRCNVIITLQRTIAPQYLHKIAAIERTASFMKVSCLSDERCGIFDFACVSAVILAVF